MTKPLFSVTHSQIIEEDAEWYIDVPEEGGALLLTVVHSCYGFDPNDLEHVDLQWRHFAYVHYTEKYSALRSERYTNWRCDRCNVEVPEGLQCIAMILLR